MYKSTSAQVWDGERLSEKFNTHCGLRQGCLLSPVLFSLLINDITEDMEGGVNIDGLAIKSLLYADDLVLLAEDPQELQKMITKLEEYCEKWNLVVNLNKSKIMIFKNGGGRRGSNENWVYRATNIKVVRRYKYLGINLTPKISMKVHLKERLTAAKGTLNSSLKSLIRNTEMNYSSKFRVYTATAKSLLCYGAQVWGFTEYEEVERLQRFFIKKIFTIPNKTPNYVLALETGLTKLYIDTLKYHFDYIIRIFSSYGENRFPRMLALKTIENKVYWYAEWLNLAEKHNVQFNPNWQNAESLTSVLYLILEKEQQWQIMKAQEKARQTVRHGLYDKLNYNLGTLSYFKDNFSAMKIKLILTYRSGMLPLNASPWRAEGSPLCSLCNMDEDEDFIHYLAICPVLKEFRKLAFNKTYLTESEAVSILNGEDFEALCRYAKQAWKYRQILIQEFNN